MSAAFSLVLPVYRANTPEQVDAAFISSVDAQSHRPDEVVIVEDGPITVALDHALERLARDSAAPVVRVRLPENRGLAAALNEGIRAASHDIVARMDADDISHPGRFAAQLPPMAERSLDVLGTGLAEFVSTTDRVEAVRVPPVGEERIRRAITFRQPFHHPTVMLRRSTVLEAGGYRTDVGRFEDYVLFATLIARGAAVDNLPEPLVFYRLDDGAYERRGGRQQFASEIRLQRELRALGLIGPVRQARNILIRASYRLAPTSLRRTLYRRFATER